ncbi:hypothetical protein EI545_09170 [Tabrizicola piscis]|uniref:Zinc finger/thioredoxin putative domain-containing protein n=1 Tax=Tabrizicola piscis TaxID=2494374 RepID=A0A3S8U5N6_9RHOB|nr:zinc-ribbon domain-containing protein [Tabrizicola piscis]AZL58992.1 hypothetical protein EI545_09170 [Tabrizicola piscis]
MRLVCPNCEAKYEVPEDAIPDTGRDVQCANCGHAWFQMRQRSAAAPVDEAPPAAVAETPVAEPVAEVTPEPETSPAALTDPGPEALVEVAAEAPVEEPLAAVEETPPPVAAVETADIPAEVAAIEPEKTPEGVAEPAPEVELDAKPDSASADLDSALAEADAVIAKLDAEVAGEAGALGDTRVQPVADTAAEIEPEAVSEPAPGESDTDAPAPAPAYAVDESVLAILREEAEREAQARRAEARPLESQTDLGIDAAMPGRQKPALVASNGALLDGDTEAAHKPSARRDLLPDVEEINSTLRPSETATEAADGQPLPPVRESMGFRSGFLMVMTVAIIGAAVYIMAPRLSGWVPAMAAPLESYVSAVDGLRLSLDGMMRSATVAINGE